MANFSEIHLEEPTTVTAEMRTVVWDIQSSNQHGEVLVIGDPESSDAIARVTNTPPESTVAALSVRIAGGPSSLVDFPVRVIFPSSALNNPVSFPSTQSVQVKNSTIGDLLATVQQASTAWQVQLPTTQSFQVKNSTIGDLQATVQQASTAWQVQLPSSQSFQVKNSTIGDLLASVQQNSTVWQVQLPSSQSFQVKNSTIGDLLASVQQNSTVWQVQANMTQVRPSTLTRASLTQSSTSVTAQASNIARLGWSCYNHPTEGAQLYLKFGATASTTDFDLRLPAFSLYEMPQPIFTGRIDAIWDSTGVGYARTVEFT